MFHEFTVDELIQQGYTPQHARQFISREAVRVRNAKATKKVRDEATARFRLPKDSPKVVTPEPTPEKPVRLDRNGKPLSAKMLAGLEKAHAARRAQAQAKREASAAALNGLKENLSEATRTSDS